VKFVAVANEKIREKKREIEPQVIFAQGSGEKKNSRRMLSFVFRSQW
jgi:hypothetical protein